MMEKGLIGGDAMNETIEKTKEHLGELAGLSAKTEQAEKRILFAATKRLDIVQKDIDGMQAGIEGKDDAEQDKYMELITERGQLNNIIAKSKSTLGL